MRSAAEVAEMRTGVFSDKWMEQVQRNSEMSANFANVDFASRARSVLGSNFDAPKYQQALDSIHRIIGSTSIVPNPAIIENAAVILRSPRKKKVESGNQE